MLAVVFDAQPMPSQKNLTVPRSAASRQAQVN